MARSNYFEITTSGNLPALASSILREVRTLGDTYARTVAEIFVERAKAKLAMAYPNTSNLTDNIFYQRAVGYGNYRIGLRENEEKEVMFYLEFGTGLVGEQNPHPQANEFDWFYVEDPKQIEWTDSGLYTQKKKKKDSGSWVYKDGEPYGWYYFDKKLGTIRFTRGLKAVRYMWDTLQEMDDIKAEAERRMKNVKSTLPRHRIVRG